MVEAKPKKVKLFKDFISYNSEEEYLNDKSCINAHMVMSYATEDTLGFRKKTGEKQYFTIGKLTEDIVFHPELVNDKYFVVQKHASEQSSKLADSITSWVLRSLDPTQELTSLETTEEGNEKLMSIVRDLDIFNNVKKLDTLILKLQKEKFFETIKTKLNNLTKLAITEDDYNLASKLAEKIIKSKATKNIFDQRGKEHVEFIDQFRVKVPDFFAKGLTAKIAVDLLIVDHNTRRVFFYDIKTDRHSTHEFINESYNKYRIDIQLDFYDKALYNFVQKHFPTYQLNTGKLIVVSKEYLSQEAAVFAKKTRGLLREDDAHSNVKQKDLRKCLLEIMTLADMAGGLEKLQTLDQVSDYYFNGNYIQLPN